jgi:two-component system OmpR family sensor kinase
VNSRGPDHSLLQLLQSLLDLPALDLRTALTGATTQVASWLNCEKVDAFLLDERRASLVAVGTSRTALGERQKALGLDVLPLANGGRIVGAFQTGASFATGRSDLDEDELVGMVRDLGIRSTINVGLEIGGVRRGVLTVASQQPDRFGDDDVSLVELVARWVGALAHRAELVEKVRVEEGARSRLATAERIITVVSHDIRNHLHPLTGRLQLLQLKLTQNQPIDPHTVDSMLLVARRLSRMTSTWLDLSRLDQGLFDLHLAPLDLSALVNETCTALAGPKAQIQVAAPPTLPMVGDAERLRQALENVVANAVRYSPLDRPVQVAVERHDGLVRVLVTDHGPGIPPELLPHLFERFVASSSSGGIGLGLYLAERIVVAHGGRLHARTAPGAGAQFVFELPLDANRAESLAK